MHLTPPRPPEEFLGPQKLSTALLKNLPFVILKRISSIMAIKMLSKVEEQIASKILFSKGCQKLIKLILEKKQ